MSIKVKPVAVQGYGRNNLFPDISRHIFEPTMTIQKDVLLFLFSLLICRGMTEGVTLLILAVQTGLIELQVVHRAFLLSIILFIVVASILQSMLEIADPIVLALGASRDK